MSTAMNTEIPYISLEESEYIYESYCEILTA